MIQCFRILDPANHNGKIDEELPSLFKANGNTNIIDNVVYANKEYAKISLKGGEGDCYRVTCYVDKEFHSSYRVSNTPTEFVNIQKENDTTELHFTFDAFKEYLTGNLFAFKNNIKQNKIQKYDDIDWTAIFKDVEEMIKDFFLSGKEFIEFIYIPNGIITTKLVNLGCNLGKIIAKNETITFIGITFCQKDYVIGIQEAGFLICTKDYFTKNLVKNQIIGIKK